MATLSSEPSFKDVMSQASSIEWDLRSPEVQSDQMASYDAMRSRCPVAHTPDDSWVVFRQLKFDMDAMARLINSNTIGLYVFIGKFDKIITEKMMARLLRQVPSHQLQTLQAGHNDLIEKSIVPLRNIGVKSP